jgi:sarcosine oxidase/L-pipecolate oxidase
MVLTADGGGAGREYVSRSYKNVSSTPGARVADLPNASAVREAVGTGGSCGGCGYVNRGSGWVDASAAIASLRGSLYARGNVTFETATVACLIYRYSAVAGARLACGREVTADLTVVAAGAWSPSLADLRGRVLPTGHVMAYIRLTESEQARYAKMPVVLNLSSGLFVIPPSRGVIKFGQHSQGYTSRTATPSFPPRIPADGERWLRDAVREVTPEFAGREFESTRLCWYTDTPDGDFLVCYHPGHKGLFFATGGSGHAFKFLPVLGEEIVDVMECRPDAAFAEKWAWKEHSGFSRGDGSRGDGGLELVDLEVALRDGKEKSRL